MGLKETVSKTTIANVISALVIIIGTVYFAYKGDIESLKWVLAFALGYLFGRAAK